MCLAEERTDRRIVVNTYRIIIIVIIIIIIIVVIVFSRNAHHSDSTVITKCVRQLDEVIFERDRVL